MIRASNPRNRENRQTICTIVTAREHVLEALRLVHDEYVRSGLTLQNSTGIRVTRYHLLSSTEILAGLVEEELVCTMSLVHDSDIGLPMESIYGGQVQEFRDQGKQVAEVSCLANRRDNAEETLKLVIRLMAFIVQLAAARQVHELLIAVHPRHRRFYERFLGFRQVGGVKYYSTVCGNPAVAMALDLVNLHETNPKPHDRLFGRPFPQHRFKQRQLAPDVLESLRGIYLQEAEASRMPRDPDGLPYECQWEVITASTP